MKCGVSCLILITFVLAGCYRVPAIPPTPTFNAIQYQGQTVFNLRCAQCHAIEPETIVRGPSLAGIATRAGTRVDGYDAQAYIEQSILTPDIYIVDGFPNAMPVNFSRELTVEELDELVAYLMTLK